MKETEELIGTEEDFRTLVRNSLQSLGCSVQDNKDLDRTLRIDFRSTLLAVPGQESVIEKATFDPKLALQNKDIVAAKRWTSIDSQSH